mgnify:CR=1 FL=1
MVYSCVFFLQAEDGIGDLVRSRGLGVVYKRQGRGGWRHGPGQAAEPVQIALAGGVQDRPGAEEQHRFEGRVAHDEEDDRDQGDIGDRALSGGAQQHRDSESGDHETEVFGRRVGQQPFEIRGHRGLELSLIHI